MSGGMKKTVYCLFVNGIPKAQPRPRRARNGGVYNPPAADAWKAEIKAAFMRAMVRPAAIDGPAILRVNFYLPVLRGMKNAESRPCVKKPDADNLLKSTMDAMTRAGVRTDDNLVFDCRVEKRYAADSRTGAQIIVETETAGQGPKGADE